MSVDVVTDPSEVERIEIDCAEATHILMEGYSLLRESSNHTKAISWFSTELATRVSVTRAHPQSAVAAMSSFWNNMAYEVEKINFGSVITAMLLGDEAMVGRSHEETVEALACSYLAPGWYGVSFALREAGGAHVASAGVMRGRLLWGDVLARWRQSDPWWVVSGSAVLSWMTGEVRDEASALEMIGRVDDTLSTLARMR
jgi:hypothetical protein